MRQPSVHAPQQWQGAEPVAQFDLLAEMVPGKLGSNRNYWFDPNLT